MSRRVQPFRRGARQPGDALAAMLRGRTTPGGWNPADVTRAAQVSKAAKRRKRPARPKRPAR